MSLPCLSRRQFNVGYQPFLFLAKWIIKDIVKDLEILFSLLTLNKEVEFWKEKSVVPQDEDQFDIPSSRTDYHRDIS